MRAPDGTTAAAWRLGIAEASRLVRERALRPSELVAAVLERAGATEPSVGAYVALDPDRALAAARDLDRELERGSWRGPLHGIPLAVKDVMDVAGLPTRRGSGAFDDAPAAAADAAVVKRLRDAGAVVIGKTTTSELAAGSDSPPTRNPWDAARSPGGSSGGSAAAVAARSALGALGTDTLGSIRLPAALCGVVGMKPTFGLVPHSGVRTGTRSLDHVGPLARSVEDVALLLEAMALRLGASSGAEGPPRVGVVRGLFLEDADGAVARAVARAADALAGRGAAVSEVTFPDLDGALDAGFAIAGRELASYLRWPAMRGADRVGDRVRGLLDAAVARSDPDLRAARRRRAVLAAGVRSLFRQERLDAILTVSVPIVAPLQGERVLVREGGERSVHVLLTRCLAPFDLTGQPAVSIPVGLSEDGLPVAVQLVGSRGADRELLTLARSLEGSLLPVGLGPPSGLSAPIAPARAR